MTGLTDDVVLLIHSDNTDAFTAFRDNSDSDHTVTRTNNTEHDTGVTPPLDLHSSILFDGTGDDLTSADSDDWFFDGDFVIDMQVYATDTTGFQTLAGQSVDGNNFWSWRLVTDATNITRLRFQLDVGGSNLVDFDITGLTLARNTWHHIAIQRDVNNWCVWGNGTVLGTLSNSSSFSNFAAALQIGSIATLGDFQGNMNEIRIIKGATAYTHNTSFTAPTVHYTDETQSKGFIDSNTVLMLHCDGLDTGTTFTDSSQSSHVVTAVNQAQTSTTLPKFGTASCLLDGSGDRLSIPDSTDFDYGTGDFTIEAWLKKNVAGNADNFYRQDGGTEDFEIEAGHNETQLLVNSTVSGLTLNITGEHYDVQADGEWYHIAIVRSGSTFYIFQNGILRETDTDANATTVAAAALLLGGNGTTDYDGNMDEIRIQKGAAIWTRDFDVPTTAYESPEPSISSVAPDEGFAIGGTSITVSGAGFITGLTSVTFGGDTASSIVVANSTTLSCDTPVNPDGSVDVVVVNGINTSTLSSGYTYLDPAPVSVTPNMGLAVRSALVSIAGSAFAPAATASFDGTVATDITVVTTSLITCRFPLHTAATVNVTVLNGGTSTGSLANGFTYLDPAPVSVAPAFGTPKGGTTVTISGTAFDASATCSFDGTVAANITNTSSSQISCETPAHAAGNVNVTVTNASTSTGSITNGYNYSAALHFGGGFAIFGATTVTSERIAVQAIVWDSSGATSGELCEVTDRDGNTVFTSQANTESYFNRTYYNKIFKGLTVSDLDSGVLYIYKR